MKCTKCLEEKSADNFYKRSRVNGKVYWCKQCHRQYIKDNKKDPDKSGYWYKRLERIRKSARHRGLECNLTYQDLKEIKTQRICAYCKTEVEVITLDRIDNTLGYIKDNIIGVCYECNKVKNILPLTVEDMEIIGPIIRRRLDVIKAQNVSLEKTTPTTAS